MKRWLDNRVISSLTTVIDNSSEKDETLTWLNDCRRSLQFEVSQISFENLSQWHFDIKGNLKNHSGAFFIVEGIQIETNYGHVHKWSQPIINQNEVGCLGLLVREIEGKLECLVQAKAEPGNINAIQLSPTVQATQSNFLRVHGGDSTRYIEYFHQMVRCNILADVLQSEQGSRFLRKRNRNVIIEIFDDPPLFENYRWVSLRGLHSMLEMDNIVNMATRSVLACLPFTFDTQPNWCKKVSSIPGVRMHKSSSIIKTFTEPEDSLHTMTEIISWLVNLRQCWNLFVNQIPLKNVDSWYRTIHKISHENEQFFNIIAVLAKLSSREIKSWSQPMISPRHEGIVGFLVKKINDQLHILVQAKLEAGIPDNVQIAPTIQCTPKNYEGLSEAQKPPFLSEITDASQDAVLYSAYLSEEGGRFFQHQNRYIIVETQDAPSEERDGFLWITPAQLKGLLRHGNLVNIEARSLLSCLMTLICPPIMKAELSSKKRS